MIQIMYHSITKTDLRKPQGSKIYSITSHERILATTELQFNFYTCVSDRIQVLTKIPLLGIASYSFPLKIKITVKIRNSFDKPWLASGLHNRLWKHSLCKLECTAINASIVLILYPGVIVRTSVEVIKTLTHGHLN